MPYLYPPYFYNGNSKKHANRRIFFSEQLPCGLIWKKTKAPDSSPNASDGLLNASDGLLNAFSSLVNAFKKTAPIASLLRWMPS
jgi:hypothetical protein